MSNITKRDFIKILPAAVPATLLSGVTGSLIAPALADTHKPRISLDSVFVYIGDEKVPLENRNQYLGFSSIRVNNVDTEAYKTHIQKAELPIRDITNPSADTAVNSVANGLRSLMDGRNVGDLNENNTRLMAIARNLLQGAVEACENPWFQFSLTVAPRQLRSLAFVFCGTVLFLNEILDLNEDIVRLALDTSP